MENRRLYRSQKQKTVAGVCGGLGNYFNMDPVIWRVIFVVLALAGASGILIYIILWIALPEEHSEFQHFDDVNSTGNFSKTNARNSFRSDSESPSPFSDNGPLWGGIILIILGSLFLIDKFIPTIHFGDLWPILLIAVGFILLYNAYKENQNRNNHQ
jgi:phage shock protein PspC (stress-responsive transcriptional regulator)